MCLLGIYLARLAAHVAKVPPTVLATASTVFCISGAFAVNNSFFDAYRMLGFGIAGYIMGKLKVPVAPLVVGLIPGQMPDVSLHQPLLISGGSWMIFFGSLFL